MSPSKQQFLLENTKAWIDNYQVVKLLRCYGGLLNNDSNSVCKLSLQSTNALYRFYFAGTPTGIAWSVLWYHISWKDVEDLGAEKNNEKEPHIIAANPMGLGNSENITNCYEITHSQCYLIFSQLVNGILTTACVLLGTIGNLHSIKSIHMTNLDKNKGALRSTVLRTFLPYSALTFIALKLLLENKNSEKTIMQQCH
ncbi:unnamed protein product [Toxocara canis]|uniref:Transmembrane protein n=1 Tax=Toxocara canis TaxID=6265 RepID=A0A183UQI0_TOXCA|nr:unnamed protein product [Toxocara canis]